MLLALGAALLLGSPATGAPPAMPSAIASYYRDYNFVNAFSSPAERRVLAKTATARADRRLAQVARALARLAERTEEVDPGIVLQDGQFGGRRRHESEFAADVVRIHSWHVDKAKAEAWVEVEGLILEDRVRGCSSPTTIGSRTAVRRCPRSTRCCPSPGCFRSEPWGCTTGSASTASGGAHRQS